MPFSIGIIGLPNVGKSTLFKALTQKEVDISNYPFCTIQPNHGIVAVPDSRLNKLSAIIKPFKTTPTIIEFVDIAGLVKNAHQGEGLGNQFLSHIRETDLILHLVRAFEDANVAHPEKTINPQRDIDIVNTELILKDLETVEKKLAEVKKKIKAGDKKNLEELAILQKLKTELEQGKIETQQCCVSTNEKIIKELFLLTAKPVIYILNINSDKQKKKYQSLSGLRPEMNSVQALKAEPRDGSLKNILLLDSKMETEINELTAKDIKELGLQSSLDQIIQACYNALDLITFYTIAGNNEVRAWTLKRNESAQKAAGRVHTDFEEKFIKALVINFSAFIKINSWHKAQAKGLIKTQGKEYTIKDGDIIEFKI